MSASEERDRLLSQLRAAHRIAGIGSWEGVFEGGRQSLDWSPEVHEIAGWRSSRPPTFTDFVSLVHPDDRPAFFESRDAALAGRKPYAMDLRLVRPDGAVRHVHIAADVIRGADGAPARLVGVVQDRTEEIEALRRLRVIEASRRQLLERLLDAADRERERIERHLAAGAVEQLRAVEASMSAVVGDDAPEAWHDALDSVRRSIETLTATLAAFTEGPGADLGAVVADLAADARSSFEVDCQVELDGTLRPGVRTVVVRLVQEALQNVRKHAEARRATVQVRSEGEEVVVRVADDGRGFDPAAAHGSGREHFGLASLRDDVDALGGRLAIRSEGVGTVLEAHLPAG